MKLLRYTGEGMEEEEFIAAECALKGLIDEYNACNEQDDYEDDYLNDTDDSNEDCEESSSDCL